MVGASNLYSISGTLALSLLISARWREDPARVTRTFGSTFTAVKLSKFWGALFSSFSIEHLREERKDRFCENPVLSFFKLRKKG